MRSNKQLKPKVFISWSGENGKKISIILKRILEKEIFSDHLECFVSDMDIASGEDWWNKIKKELRAAKLGILCITKENIESPWIHYEAGALVGNNVRTIPLLFNCNFDALQKTPLNGRQCVMFHDKGKFLKMIHEINRDFRIVDLDEKLFSVLLDNAYRKMQEEMRDVEEKLRKEGFFNLKYVYPQEIKTINRKSVFVSAPMSSLKRDQYIQQRYNLMEIVKTLKDIGFSRVICPAAEIEDKDHFEGMSKAIHDNFINLKQCECFVMVYESNYASSALIEVGYAIALCKKVVVFYKNRIPYLLQKAGENIQHVHTVHFNNYLVIVDELLKSKMSLFGFEDYEQ